MSHQTVYGKVKVRSGTVSNTISMLDDYGIESHRHSSGDVVAIPLQFGLGDELVELADGSVQVVQDALVARIPDARIIEVRPPNVSDS